MKSLLDDIRFAVRQLWKTPGFTATVLLTLALGIGANAAIFTLVHSIMLRRLPVDAPKALYRLGDRDDCCVNSGTRDDGKYSLFSTDAYLHLRKALPEFEELAAMESGFNYRPLTVRREGSGALARSAMGEFVSGNYFRTFGLQPAAGRLFADSDDVQGAPSERAGSGKPPDVGLNGAVRKVQLWRRDGGLWMRVQETHQPVKKSRKADHIRI